MRLVVCSVLIALGCSRPPQVTASPAEFRRSVSGSDWTLVVLAETPAATGAGGRRATLHFHADSARVAGFAGCNRYAGGYTVDGQALRFAPLAMTKMACVDGMVLENHVADALGRTNRYELATNGLTLFEGATVVAQFTR